MSTPFLRVRPWKFARFLQAPAEPLTIFFPTDTGVFVLVEIFGIAHFRRRKANKHSISVRQGHIKHVYKISGSISKTAWTCGLLCSKRAKITASYRKSV